jgi:hypothetical protein
MPKSAKSAAAEIGRVSDRFLLRRLRAKMIAATTLRTAPPIPSRGYMTRPGSDRAFSMGPGVAGLPYDVDSFHFSFF